MSKGRDATISGEMLLFFLLGGGGGGVLEVSEKDLKALLLGVVLGGCPEHPDQCRQWEFRKNLRVHPFFFQVFIKFCSHLYVAGPNVHLTCDLPTKPGKGVIATSLHVPREDTNPPRRSTLANTTHSARAGMVMGSKRGGGVGSFDICKPEFLSEAFIFFCELSSLSFIWLTIH